MVYQTRLHESKAQINALRKGLASIIPIHLLSLLHWRELETLVCGKRHISWDLLKRHTRYRGDLHPNLPHIQNFWEVLEEFDQEMRQKFVKFAWAQERLPADDDEFVRLHVRFQIKPPVRLLQDPDGCFPKADTCFFNLELPPYSTKEILRKRLVYAIKETITMNADEPAEDDFFIDDAGQFS